MDENSFKSWLELYGRAWKTLNPSLISELFTKEATYHEKQFDKPITGIDAIIEYWNIVSQTQKDVEFDYEIIAVTPTQGIAHWIASFTRENPKTRVELDGIFVVNLNSENKCTQFREWWHSRKTITN